MKSLETIGCDLLSLTLFHSSRVQQVICNQQTELDIDALVISPLLTCGMSGIRRNWTWGINPSRRYCSAEMYRKWGKPQRFSPRSLETDREHKRTLTYVIGVNTNLTISELYEY